MNELNRRQLLVSALAFASASLVPVAGHSSTQALLALKQSNTPPQPEGPFYPIIDQLDKDSDLIVVAGAVEIAAGEVILVEGFVRDQNEVALPSALVEIWQACHTGKYNHPSDPNTAPLDPNFQYWGKAVTDENGFYRFRTILPGAYPAGDGWIRPPHIHFKIAKLGYNELITQMYFSGQELNDLDLILQDLPKEEQDKLVVPLREFAHAGSEVLRKGQFDITLRKVNR